MELEKEKEKDEKKKKRFGNSKKKQPKEAQKTQSRQTLRENFYQTGPEKESEKDREKDLSDDKSKLEQQDQRDLKNYLIDKKDRFATGKVQERDSFTGKEPTASPGAQRDAELKRMIDVSQSNLIALKKMQDERIHRIRVNCQSEELMEKLVNYELLSGDSKLEKTASIYLNKLERQAGDDHAEKRFRISEKAGSVQNEIARLRHEQYTVKDRFKDMIPEGIAQIKQKYKPKNGSIYGSSLREWGGRDIDREPDSGAWS